jgi:glycosyltransferase involved in cell wall biosynthesis
VLDDCSTDGSVEVIRKYSQRHHRSIDLVCSETNSGSVFKQWRVGIERARGDYIWIAEADDDSDERFLQLVLEQIARNDAAFCFCDSWQISTDGKRLGGTYIPYLNQLTPAAFDATFSMTGREFLVNFLSVKNVILNVSGVVFRRSALLSAMDRIGSELYQYKVAGDWRLYAELCSRDQRVAYDARALNGHRRHQSSVTHSLDNQRHYAEIVALQDCVADRVELSEEKVQARLEYLREVRLTLNVESKLAGTSATTAALQPSELR